jgi:DNA mismatch repair protein MutL
MARIQQLTPQVVNKIAAGEVIERPASVVKELLENSVDALATRIEVDIGEGGTELIRVVDDGEGIDPADLPLAVTSHATSKLRDADDLFRVRTLGFRGEALASIAEVSRFRLRSRTHDRSEGAEIEVNFGSASPVRPCGCPEGTQTEIRDLFANTPVRRKFLKSASTEFGHISEQFTKIALANPRLHAVLRHNGKLVYELPATEQLLDRITLFFGAELAGSLIRVESEFGGVRLWGYVAHPSQSKANRKGQFLFLNGRWIQDRSLQHALMEAYRGLLMVGRNPVTFLFLEMPAETVDVNVHPTKVEVRFREGQALYRQLLSSIRTKFLQLDLNSELRVRAPSGSGLVLQPVGGPRTFDPQQQQQTALELAAWAREQTAAWRDPGFSGRLSDEELAAMPPQFVAVEPPRETAAEAGFPVARSGFGAGDFGTNGGAVAVEEALPRGVEDEPPVSPADAAARTGDGSVSTATPDEAVPPSPVPQGPHFSGDAQQARAMQIHDSYLVVETDEGLTVVDQHALHERILYEHLRNRVLAGTVESQRLLVPVTVELAPNEVALLKEHGEVLRQFGLVVEEFGGGTVLVNAYPVMLRRSDPARIVRDVAEQLAESGQNPSRRDLLDKLLHMMSCKAAVKAGQRLSPEEIESLLAQRHLIDDAHHCPHGRPTALVLSRAELDRQFGRLG